MAERVASAAGLRVHVVHGALLRCHRLPPGRLPRVVVDRRFTHEGVVPRMHESNNPSDSREAAIGRVRSLTPRGLITLPEDPNGVPYNSRGRVRGAPRPTDYDAQGTTANAVANRSHARCAVIASVEIGCRLDPVRCLWRARTVRDRFAVVPFPRCPVGRGASRARPTAIIRDPVGVLRSAGSTVVAALRARDPRLFCGTPLGSSEAPVRPSSRRVAHATERLLYGTLSGSSGEAVPAVGRDEADAGYELRCVETRTVRAMTAAPPQNASAPASATEWSCFPLPPLTPMAPTTLPSRFSGMPPAKIMTRPPFEA